MPYLLKHYQISIMECKWITCFLLPFTDGPPETVDAAADISHQTVTGTDEIRLTKYITL